MDLWINRLSARAERRFWRHWGKLPPNPKLVERVQRSAQDADYLARKIEEGAKYLLVANGAVLVATISGIGEAWKEPALQEAFKILISNFGNGLALSIFAWIIAAAAVQNLLGFKFDFAERGYAQRTRKRWLWVSVSFVSFLVLAAFDIVILSRASFSISKLL